MTARKAKRTGRIQVSKTTRVNGKQLGKRGNNGAEPKGSRYNRAKDNKGWI